VAALRKKQGVEEKVLDLDTLLNSGIEDYAAWKAIRELIEKRRKLVDSEVKQQVTMGELVHVKEVSDLFQAVTACLRRRVKDKETLAKIQQDFITLTKTDTIDWS
jgi:hypothetical protein